MELSRKLSGIRPSATLLITSAAKQMKKAGEDVIILAAGEPDFDTHDSIKEAAIEAINKGFTKYTPASGMLSLKKAVCDKLKKDNGLEYGPENIIISNGAKHSIYNVLQAVCNPGDEVLIIPPYWLSYPEMIKLAGAKPVAVGISDKSRLKASSGDIEKAVTKNTKAIIINSPSNPAGVIYSREELGEIARVCVKNDIFVISDEIYEKIIFDGKKHFSIAALDEDIKKITAVVNGVSKSYSMTGWRIGYAASYGEVSKLISNMQSHATSNPCSISQVAAEAALKGDLEDYIKKNAAAFQERRDVLMRMLEGESRIKCFKPEGAFYMFCDISGCGMDSLSFSRKLLESVKVTVIPGGPFGDDGSIRISFATDMNAIKEGVKRIREWINGL